MLAHEGVPNIFQFESVSIANVADTPYADMDGGTIRASADALWILVVCVANQQEYGWMNNDMDSEISFVKQSLARK